MNELKAEIQAAEGEQMSLPLDRVNAILSGETPAELAADPRNMLENGLIRSILGG